MRRQTIDIKTLERFAEQKDDALNYMRQLDCSEHLQELSAKLKSIKL